MKKLSFIILIILITSVLGCGSSTAFAQVPLTGIEGSYVLDDLDGSTIAGKPFDVKDYPLSNTTQTKVLSLWEHKFNKDSNKQSEYGLYLYVYNPTGYGVQEVGSRLSIATKYSGDKATDYSHYNLKLLSCSTGEYKNLFLKYKVLFVDDVLKRVNGQETRRYDIAELEVRYSNFDLPIEVAGKSEAFDVGNTYVYTGYLAGCGSDENTLKCTTKDIDVLGLEVHQAWWRYKNGENTVKQISTAYFGIPEEITDRFDGIKSIKANWFETHMQPMTVFTDSGYHALFDPYVGTLLKVYKERHSHVNETGGVDIPLKYWLQSKVDTQTNYLYGHSWWTYNLRGSGGPLVVNEYEQRKLMLNFYVSSGKVSTDEVLRNMQAYTSKFGGELLINKYSKELFMAEVDEGRQYGWQGSDGKGVEIAADSKFVIDGFDVGASLRNWFQNLIKEFETIDTPEISPIAFVKDEDLIGDNTTIAAKLYIDESEVDNLLKTYAANKLAGKKTVVFRFAVTDYSTWDLGCGWHGCSAFDVKNVGYLVEQTAFLDFDIIWLKFVKDNVETVIPVAQKPVDVVGGLTPTPGTDPDNTSDVLQGLKDFWNSVEKFFGNVGKWLSEYWWVIVVGFVVVGIVVTLCIKFGAKVLWFALKWTIFLPFTLLAYGIKAATKKRE